MLQARQMSLTRALAIDEKALGPGHPNVAVVIRIWAAPLEISEEWRR